MPKVLFFDFQYSGHHVEYVNHLVSNIGAAAENSYFAVPAELRGRLTASTETIRFIDVPDFAEPIGPALFRKQGAWIVETALACGVEIIFFLNLDPYQYVIGTAGFRRSGLKVAGILFSPPHRLIPSAESPFKEKAKQWLRRKRKAFQLWWALRNRCIKAIFILDDKSGVYQLNGQFRPVFRLLNDPIEEKEIKASAISGALDIITPNEKLLLAFGSVIPRKNLKNIITSLSYTRGQKFTLLIAGKGDPEYIKELKSIASSYDDHASISVQFINRFVSAEEMESYFHHAAGVLMIYLKFYGSSGVLGHAARHRTPVLVSDTGLVAELTKEYSLGYSVKPGTRSIALGIQQLLDEGLPTDFSGEKYLAPKSINNFSSTIYSLFDHTLDN